MGCPSGVGPEIAVVAVREARRRGMDCRILGDRGALFAAAETLGLDADRLIGRAGNEPSLAHRIPILETVAPLSVADRLPGKPSVAGGVAQLSWIDRATDLAKRGDAAAIVTGPVSKDVIAHCGAPGADSFLGHTEHIARRLGPGEPVMVFVADAFAVSLVTTHLPLRDVADHLSVPAVLHATVETIRLLARLGCRPPRVLVSALNPHAGEGGLMGHEEATILAPAVEAARSWALEHGMGVVDGPTPAEAAFRIAMGGAYDGVVAMYHDQGTIPMKLRFFGRAVNVTAGLSIVRTSVDHGTAYDIAGKGKAEAGSLLEAIRLADRLVRGTPAKDA